ncbi:MAG: energy transducer TonB [Bryobacteraceae bacterium]
MTLRFWLALLMAGGAVAQSPDDALSQGVKLTASQAQTVEESLRANPEDLAAHAKLIAYYYRNRQGEPWSRHVFWLIEHHPESSVAVSSIASGAAPADSRNFQADWAHAKELWLEQTRRHPDDAHVWANALRFCVLTGCDAGARQRLLKHAEELGVPKWELDVSDVPPEPTARIRVGGDVQATMLIKRVEPTYSPLVHQVRIRGVVRFTAIIGTDGHVRDLQVISGHPLLIRTAQEAVQQWVYRPTLVNGKPVEVSTEIEFPFNLPEDTSASGGSEAPPAPTRVRVGGNVQAALLLKRVEPVYPRDAWVEGTVRFTATIGADGHVQNLQLVSGDPQLAPAAVNAVMQWVYRPTVLNGKPVEVVTTIDVPFTLPANR